VTLDTGRRSIVAQAMLDSRETGERYGCMSRLPNEFGINLPPVPLMVEKKNWHGAPSCVCLLRPINEGYSSPALDLRAFAPWAFRDQPAWRRAADAPVRLPRTNVAVQRRPQWR